MKIKKLLKYLKRRRFDCYAAEMIPIRMIISIGIIAGISLLLAVGYATMSVKHAENMIKNDILSLQSQLYLMTATGTPRDVDEIAAAEGTKRVQIFTLPSSIQYLSFGVDPDKNNTGILSPGLDEDGAVIFYKVSGSSKNVIWLSQNQIRFREGVFNQTKNSWDINKEPQGFILESPGEVKISFELVKQQDEFYILIQATDIYDL
ncbi:MAG: hypothetical protein R6V50_01220 [Thermoplasmatota archaeon]